MSASQEEIIIGWNVHSLTYKFLLRHIQTLHTDLYTGMDSSTNFEQYGTCVISLRKQPLSTRPNAQPSPSFMTNRGMRTNVIFCLLHGPSKVKVGLWMKRAGRFQQGIESLRAFSVRRRYNHHITPKTGWSGWWDIGIYTLHSGMYRTHSDSSSIYWYAFDKFLKHWYILKALQVSYFVFSWIYLSIVLIVKHNGMLVFNSFICNF